MYRDNNYNNPCPSLSFSLPITPPPPILLNPSHSDEDYIKLVL